MTTDKGALWAWVCKGLRAVRTSPLVRDPPDPRRAGECLRCGACCALAVPCEYAGRDAAGLATCAIYQVRPWSCRGFPLSAGDLRELPPGVRCGYSFPSRRRPRR
jgi:hypothetical protein